MASVTFSSTSEFYNTRKFDKFRNLDQCRDRGSFCTSTSVESAPYTLSLLQKKKRIGTKQTVSCFCFCIDCRFCLSNTGFTQITGDHHLDPPVKARCIKVSRVEGTSTVAPASELIELDEHSGLDNRLRSMPEVTTTDGLIGENQTLKGRKLWTKVFGKKRVVERKYLRPGLRKYEKQIALKRNDSVAHISVNLENVLSDIGPESSIKKCNSLLKLLEKSSDEKALSFFQWMKSNGKLKENSTAYNLALRVLGRMENWQRAETLLQEMTADSGCNLNFQAFNTLIYGCYKRGLKEWATKWFHLMLEKDIHPNVATFGMLMNLYQKGGHLAEAEFTFGLMRKHKVHCPSAYSSMITIYTRLGLYDKSEEIINTMKEDNIIPNLENWLVQINAYSQQGKLEEAELVLNLMLKSGISPNIIAYNTLITGYGKAGNIEGMRRVFQCLFSMGLEPDETTYRSMIEGFGRMDSYKEALWYYKELKRSGYVPISSNFYTLINLQARHMDEEGAVETVKDMSVVGCQYSSILGSLLQAFERAGRLDRVPFILKSCFYDKIMLDQTSCSILAMTYVQNDLLDEAFQVLLDKQWKDQSFEEHLYHLLICSCKEAGHYENAIKIFSKMSKSIPDPNLHITCSMIDIYTVMSRFSEGETLYMKLKESNVALDMITYSVVVRMYVKSGSLKDACAVLETMEQRGIVPDVFLFRDMLRIYQMCKMPEKLVDVYYKILKSGITWDEAMYNCVINCCAGALQVDELSRLFDEMYAHGFSANTITFNVMLDKYGKAGMLKKARKIFWMARKQRVADAISYSTIIAAYGQNGDLKNMKSTYRRMQFSGIPVPLEAYNSMLDAYGKHDCIEDFRQVLQKLKESSCALDHYTYNIMINIYGKKGWIEEVANILAELKERDLEPDLWSYNSLINALGIAGMVEEAVNVVREMREKGIEPDKVTYWNVIGALQRNDNFLEAVKWSLWMKQQGMATSNS
ncbi:pentatricopeptide repeat-containing protein At4g30825, chloroplastic [Aristolochia californica]|uniref:pentatricopeptide repeat-containing protein At4g30825, chloroplastic n=1 Tax=Aristolochia californica TaxID=171875 RepID=UPI0035D78E26